MSLQWPTQRVPHCRDYEQPFLDDIGRIELFYKMAGWIVKAGKKIAVGERREQRWQKVADKLAEGVHGMIHSDVSNRMSLTTKALEKISAKWRNDTSSKFYSLFINFLEYFANNKPEKLYEAIEQMEETRMAWVSSSENQNEGEAEENRKMFILYKKIVQKLMDNTKTEMDKLQTACYAWIIIENEFNAFVTEQLKDVHKPPPDAYYEEMFAWKKEAAVRVHTAPPRLRKKGVVKMAPTTEPSSASDKSDKSSKSAKSRKAKELLKQKLGQLKSIMKSADGFRKSEKSKKEPKKAAASKMGRIDEDSSQKKGKSAMDRVDSSDGTVNMSDEDPAE